MSHPLALADMQALFIFVLRDALVEEGEWLVRFVEDGAEKLDVQFAP